MRSLPLDRFAGLRPIGAIGQVTLDLIQQSGDAELTRNAHAEDSIRVEVLTVAGYRIPNFTRQDSVVIKGDSLRHRIGWNNRTTKDLRNGR